MGQEKMGNLSQKVSFLSDFSPISYEFQTFFLHFPRIFGTFSHFPISPHFPPFVSISPHFPPFPPIFLHFSIFPIVLYLCGLTPTPVALMWAFFLGGVGYSQRE